MYVEDMNEKAYMRTLGPMIKYDTITYPAGKKQEIKNK
jgi:hypothetical protein